MIYLDSAATEKLLPEAKKAMLEAMETGFGNASALHTPGHLAKNLIEKARENVARLINASPEEIIFTSGGTESNNTVINIFKNQTIAVSKIEHPSVLEPAKKYAEKLHLLPVNEQGIVKTKNLPETGLFSVMLANNELGTLEPIRQIKDLLSNKTYFHTDATQAIGKIKVDVKSLGVDYLTFSAHKIGGPIGIGALFVKKGSPFTPLILGGHQEKKRRAGTYPTMNIAGFGAAAKFAKENKTWEIYEEKIRPLRDLLAKRILEEIPFSSLNTPLENSLPNILNVSFAAAEGESIQLYLDAKDGIIVSTGSACAAGDIKPSHVIMAARDDAEVAHSSIRFSLPLDTTEETVEKVINSLSNIVKNLQEISTINPERKK